MKPITRQERNVLDLIGQGYSTKLIAGMLCISFHTVQSHRRNLLRKFDATNSAQLVRKAMEGSEVSNSVTD